MGHLFGGLRNRLVHPCTQDLSSSPTGIYKYTYIYITYDKHLLEDTHNNRLNCIQPQGLNISDFFYVELVTAIHPDEGRLTRPKYR